MEGISVLAGLFRKLAQSDGGANLASAAAQGNGSDAPSMGSCQGCGGSCGPFGCNQLA